MMRKKRRSVLILAALLTFLLSGCGGESGQEGQVDFDVFLAPGSSFDGRGIVWWESEGALVRYYDLESGISTVMCARPDCQHERPTVSNPDVECDGYYDGVVSCCFLYGEHLYVLYWTPGDGGGGFNDYTLCQADFNGANRKVVAKLEGLGFPLYYSVDDGLFAIGRYRQYSDEGESLEKQQCGVCVVDLESGKVTELPCKEEYAAQVCGVYLENGLVTYQYYYYTVNPSIFYYEDGSGMDFDLMNSMMDDIYEERLMQFDMAKEREEEIAPGMEHSIPRHGYVCAEGGDGQTYLVRLSDGNSRPFPYSYVGYVRDGKMLVSRYTAEENAFEYMLYDLESGETSELIFLPDCRDRSICTIAGGKAIIEYDDGSNAGMCGWADEEELFAGQIDCVDKMHSMGKVSDFY